MPTSIWHSASYDTGFSPWQVMPDCNITIGAGGTMKKFIVTGTSVSGFTSGTDVNRVCSLYMVFEIDIVAGQYSPRSIFRTMRRVPHQVVAFHDVLTAQRVYTVSAQGNDLELGFNQRCSYGTSDGPGMTVRCRTLIANYPIGFGFPPGRANMTFKALEVRP